jgi:hypothetical protein
MPTSRRPATGFSNAHSMELREAIRLICDIHTAASEGPHGFKIGFRTPPDFVKVNGDLYWEAWRVLRQYATGDGDLPHPTHPTPKAVELFQRALQIQAAGEAFGKWEPAGRRLEYIGIDIALMRELGQGIWGTSVLDVGENAEGPPSWERNPRNIALWHDAVRLRRALLQAVREASENPIQSEHDVVSHPEEELPQ